MDTKELEKLFELKQKGIITEEQFNEKKKQLLFNRRQHHDFSFLTEINFWNVFLLIVFYFVFPFWNNTIFRYLLFIYTIYSLSYGILSLVKRLKKVNKPPFIAFIPTILLFPFYNYILTVIELNRIYGRFYISTFINVPVFSLGILLFIGSTYYIIYYSRGK